MNPQITQIVEVSTGSDSDRVMFPIVSIVALRRTRSLLLPVQTLFSL
jgi:hypothetical protein